MLTEYDSFVQKTRKEMYDLDFNLDEEGLKGVPEEKR